jgi:hypothetical protein
MKNTDKIKQLVQHATTVSVMHVCYIQRLKMLTEREKRPQRLLALEEHLQCETAGCGCFETTKTRFDVRETATT